MVTQVAVAILQNQQGEFLLASRPQGKPWAGWWEFPGGKIEVGESAEHALIRELQEELGITPSEMQPWLQRTYAYPATHDSAAKTVKLHFFFVTKWQGDLVGLESQQLSWQNPSNITVAPILPANMPIMKALALPPIYAITNLAEMSESAFFAALKTQLQQGLKLIQVREKQLAPLALMRLTGQVLKLAKPFGAKVLLNNDINLAKKLGADGAHLNSLQLMNLTEKPSDLIVAASCHNANELAHAQKLGLDFVVLSPVNATQSHVDAAPLGWQKFSEMIENIELPIYALGGMSLLDLPQALSCGARGVAMQRAVWK
jgi:8-oxo-dGTP diphosphatase